MLRSVLIGGLVVMMGACSSTTSNPGLEQFGTPNPLIKAEIKRRIEKIPYQKGTELVFNLAWLAARGEYAIPQLIEAMESPDPKVRSNAAWTLGRIRDTRTIPFLKKHLADRDPSVQMEVARALLTMGDDSGVPVLIMGLDSDDPRYRYLCHEPLKAWSGMDFGYDHNERNPQKRRKAILKWMKWWNEKCGRMVFKLDFSGSHYAVPPQGGK